mgnify:CR=1 FL=1
MSKEDQEVMEQRIAEAEEAEKKKKRKQRKDKALKEAGGFWKEFKKFITRGNVLDLAVAVVIGNAFNLIVNGLVKYIINPVISLLTGGVSLDGWKTILVEATEEKEEVAILWGEWIQTILNLLIIALTIFIAVRIIKRTSDRIHAKEIEEKKAADAKKAAADKLAAEEQAKIAAAEKAARDEFYQNVARQTKLLEQIAKGTQNAE